MAQPDRKSKIKLGQYASKWSNVRFGQKIRSTLGQIISGIKCDRDKLIFFIELGIKGVGKWKKWSNSLPPSSYGSARPS